MQFRVSRRFAWGFFWAVLGISCVSFLLAVWFSARDESLRGEIGREFRLERGPWGPIVARNILLKPAAEIFDPDFRLGDGRWYFEKASPSAIAGLLRDCGLKELQIAAILPTLRPASDALGLDSAQPPAAILVELDSEVRSRLYSRLARTEANFAQCQPFRIAASHLEEWLADLNYDPGLRSQVEKLLWRSGDTILFSDYNFVADTLREPEQRVELQRALSRKVSLRAWLDVPAGGDVEGWIGYWSDKWGGENLRTILESAASSGGARIGMIELLPPFARRHLDRFPSPSLLAENPPACHWSTFNFFVEGEPDAAFHTVEGVEGELRKNFTRVVGAPRYGDVVTLDEPDRSSIHSAVYIADDIVFTKNGPSAATPWVLSTIAEMKAFYPGWKPLSVSFYRRRGL